MSQHQCLNSESGDRHVLGDKITPHCSAFENMTDGPRDGRLLDKLQFSSWEESPVLVVS